MDNSSNRKGSQSRSTAGGSLRIGRQVIIQSLLKNWIIVLCNFSVLIGLEAMVYDPLYHGRATATIKLSSGCSCKAKSATSSNTSWMSLIKQLFHSRLWDMR